MSPEATAFHEMIPGHNLVGYLNQRYVGRIRTRRTPRFRHRLDESVTAIRSTEANRARFREAWRLLSFRAHPNEPGGMAMSRTIGAAIGAVIVFLFFVLGIAHPRLETSQADVTTAASR
jgi:hypothetical protein